MRVIIYLLVFGFGIVPMFAKPLKVDVKEIIKENYTQNVSVKRDKIILTSQEKDVIKKIAKFPVKSKIYRYFSVKSEDEIVGFGILISQKVRSKKATVLYIIDKNGSLKSIEILAFLEPKEYIPKKSWMDQFDDKNITDTFRVGRDIPTISGATLSARTIIDGARLAIALYKIKLK